MTPDEMNQFNGMIMNQVRETVYKSRHSITFKYRDGREIKKEHCIVESLTNGILEWTDEKDIRHVTSIDFYEEIFFDEKHARMVEEAKKEFSKVQAAALAKLGVTLG